RVSREGRQEQSHFGEDGTDHSSFVQPALAPCAPPPQAGRRGSNSCQRIFDLPLARAARLLVTRVTASAAPIIADKFAGTDCAICPRSRPKCSARRTASHNTSALFPSSRDCAARGSVHP